MVPLECDPSSPLFKIASKTINERSPAFTEEFLPKANVESHRHPNQSPFVNAGPPASFSTNELHNWAKSLPEGVKQPLFDINGKNTKSMRHKNISFTSEYRFRHIIPFLYLGEFLDKESQKNLEEVSFLAKQFSELQSEYGSVDTEPIRGFENYKDFEAASRSVNLNRVDEVD